MGSLKWGPRVPIWGQKDYLLLMAVGVGALQIFLDKGNENGWSKGN